MAPGDVLSPAGPLVVVYDSLEQSDVKRDAVTGVQIKEAVAVMAGSD